MRIKAALKPQAAALADRFLLKDADASAIRYQLFKLKYGIRRVNSLAQYLLRQFGSAMLAILMASLSTAVIAEEESKADLLADKFSEQGAIEYVAQLLLKKQTLSSHEIDEISKLRSSKSISDAHFVDLTTLLVAGIADPAERASKIVEHLDRLEGILNEDTELAVWKRCSHCLAHAFEFPVKGAELEARICKQIGTLTPKKQLALIHSLESVRWHDLARRKESLKSLYSDKGTTDVARFEILSVIHTAVIQNWISVLDAVICYHELAELPQHSPLLNKLMMGRIVQIAALKLNR
ncbi:hypothetical protein [Schlesneria sp. T3-172]|uniref:hypothetical protein n=1 Tax=Schlesneria sphaerica TaxID=3373610 RepID=UPI0037CBFB4A